MCLRVWQQNELPLDMNGEKVLCQESHQQGNEEVWRQ